MGDAEDRPDGRRTRGRQTQERIVDALLALIEAGDPAPANARIAEQAGISARLVYHHFQDLEDLFGVAVERRTGQILTRYPAPPVGGPSRWVDQVNPGKSWIRAPAGRPRDPRP